MVLAELARDRLVRRLRSGGRIRNPGVERAFRVVPRHLFLPAVSLDQAYADEAVAIKWREGAAISSASQPSMMAIMLEQLDLRLGHRVLEIGTGTGYNAALMAQVVGPDGLVATVDIDCELVQAARAHLAAARVAGVRLACRDGALGYPEAGPYDRIVLTVGSWDIQPAWLEQLTARGRLLLPLSVRGSQLSVALDAEAGPPAHLVSASVRSCAFIRMRGVGAGPDIGRRLDRDGFSVLAAEGREVDLDEVLDALRRPGTDRSLDVPLVVGDLWDGLGLWLAITEPDACRLLVSGEAAAGGRVPTILPGRADGGTVAVLGELGLAALLRADGGGSHPRQFRVVVRAFGSGGPAAADRLVTRVQEWVKAGRPTSAGLRVRVYPRSSEPPPEPGTTVIDKEHTRLALDWPNCR